MLRVGAVEVFQDMIKKDWVGDDNITP